MKDFMMSSNWGVLQDEEGNKLYEGFLYNGKPSGAGTVYYPDGGIYQTGVFGIKGLLAGREYYPDGVLRFEGVYRLNDAYGPNYPQAGRFFSRDGELLLEGKAHAVRRGLGWPMVLEPEEFGPALQKDIPEIHCLMWQDVQISPLPPCNISGLT